MEKDFSLDLENEKIIGAITNGYFLEWYAQRSGGNLSYYQYDLIFTKNGVFGQNLSGYKSIPTIFWLKIGNFQMPMGTVTYNFKSKYEKIDRKYIYNKINKIYLRKTQNFLKGPAAVHLELRMGIWAGCEFIFDPSLMDEAITLIKKTPLADRLVIKY